MRWLIAFPLLLAGWAPLSAQAPLNTRDTLRFLQQVKTSGEMQTPMGAQSMNVEMRMHTSAIGMGGDSVATWLDSAAFSPQLPVAGGSIDALRGRRVIIHFLPDGRVKMNSGNSNNVGYAGFAQMNTTSWGFVLPRRGELRRGTSWADTASMRFDTLGSTLDIKTVTRYEVVGDSTYEGMPVVTLATNTTSNSTSGGAMSMTAKGEGTGRAYYSRALGIIVYMTSVVQMNQEMRVGDMAMQGRSQVEAIYRMLRKRS